MIVTDHLTPPHPRTEVRPHTLMDAGPVHTPRRYRCSVNALCLGSLGPGQGCHARYFLRGGCLRCIQLLHLPWGQRSDSCLPLTLQLHMGMAPPSRAGVSFWKLLSMSSAFPRSLPGGLLPPASLSLPLFPWRPWHLLLGLLFHSQLIRKSHGLSFHTDRHPVSAP